MKVLWILGNDGWCTLWWPCFIVMDKFKFKEVGEPQLEQPGLLNPDRRRLEAPREQEDSSTAVTQGPFAKRSHEQLHHL